MNIYLRRYFKIIRYYKNNPPLNNIYTEKHHIRPRSFGGSNKKHNIVILPAKAHYIVHMILAKSFSTYTYYNRKMACAFSAMSMNKHLTATQYTKINEIKKRKLSTATRKKMSLSTKGNKLSIETRNKISKAHCRPTIINNMEFDSRAAAGKYFGVSPSTIVDWNRAGRCLAKSHRFVIKGIIFNTRIEAAKYFNVTTTTIGNWKKSGKAKSID